MARGPLRYNVNLVGLGFFIVAVTAAYQIGGWKYALWTAGVLGTLTAGRLIWVTRRNRNNRGGEGNGT